jgi:hypothetical protein
LGKLAHGTHGRREQDRRFMDEEDILMQKAKVHGKEKALKGLEHGPAIETPIDQVPEPCVVIGSQVRGFPNCDSTGGKSKLQIFSTSNKTLFQDLGEFLV